MNQSNIQKIDFLAIGNASIDIVAEISFEFLEQNNLIKSQCVVMDRARFREIKNKLEHYKMTGGGSAANMTHVFAALGGRSAFIGKINSDNEGLFFKKVMEEAGVECKLSIQNSQDLITSQVKILITPDGDRSFANHDSIAATLSSEDIDFEAIAHSQILCFDGYTLRAPKAFAIAQEAFATIQKAGGKSMFSLADVSIIHDYNDECRILAKMSDIMICNSAEAQALYPNQSLEQILDNFLSTKYAGALTMGENGAWIFKDGKKIYQPATNFDQQKIDTNGAGDHFAAGFFYGLTHDFSLEKCGLLARLCADDCLTHSGARPLGSLRHLLDRL